MKSDLPTSGPTIVESDDRSETCHDFPLVVKGVGGGPDFWAETEIDRHDRIEHVRSTSLLSRSAPFQRVAHEERPSYLWPDDCRVR